MESLGTARRPRPFARAGAMLLLGAALAGGTAARSARGEPRIEIEGLYLLDTATGGVRRILSLPGTLPVWPGPGRRGILAFAGARSLERPAELYLLDLAGRRVKGFGRFAPLDHEVHWRPDGAAFAIVARGGGRSFWLADPASGSRRACSLPFAGTITGWVRRQRWGVVANRPRGGTVCYDPVTATCEVLWPRGKGSPSSDGEWLLIEEPSDPDGEAAIVSLLRAADGAHFPLTHRAMLDSAMWDPEQTAASFVRMEGKGRRVATLRQQIRIVSGTGADTAVPSLHSDGEITDRTGRWRATRTAEGLIHDLSSPTGERWQLPARADFLSFSPGGKRAIIRYPRRAGRRQPAAMALDAFDLERRTWRPTQLRTRWLALEPLVWIEDRTVLVRLLLTEG